MDLPDEGEPRVGWASVAVLTSPRRSVRFSESRLVAGDPYEIRFFVQPGGTTFGLVRPEADGARVEVRSDGPVATLTLTSDENRTVAWNVVYAVSGRVARSPRKLTGEDVAE